MDSVDLGRRASFLLPLSLVGCKKGGTPESAAESFIDAYYLERDPTQALAFVGEGAAERVRAEQKLLSDSGVVGGGPQPRVFYKRMSATTRGSDDELRYELSIDSGGVKLKKQVVLVLRQQPADKLFKVVLFSEVDAP
jgi:hypothetical protein